MSVTANRAPESPEVRRRALRFPSAFTVLFAVTVAVWLLAFVVPTGQYELDADGRPIAGSYTEVDADLSLTDRLYQLSWRR